MIKKFDVSETKEALTVYVELNEFNRSKGMPKVHIELSDVEKRLAEEGYKHGPLRTGPVMLRNWSNSEDSGTWVFEKKKLDKVKKTVIIKEEKPKTTRRRTKKVSIEE